MLVDLILLLLAGIALFTGYHRGFLRTLFSTIGYIGGGVLGLTLSLHYLSKVESQINKFALALAAIFLGAEIGRRICGSLAQFFRTKILWAPLRLIDSVAGALLELIRTAILAYLLISLLLWAPWSVARSSIAQSIAYPKMKAVAPEILTQLRREIEKKFSINLH